MTENPVPPPDAPPPPPPPPPPPGAPPGTGEDDPNPQQPPERRLIKAGRKPRPAIIAALRDAATLALDALDYAGDRVAEKIGTTKRTSGK